MSVGQCLWCQMDRQRDTEEKKKRNTEGNETSQAKPTEKKRAKLYTTDSENDKNAPDLLNKERTQRQDQIQRQRSHEASKQMLFGVYCNVVSTLEEYEARTNRGACRLKRIKHGLSQDLNKDVEDFEREGPDDLK
ncbi:hypothetical protein DPMN_158945 [Dreissena polymorpha]|uniref:Uncharacterized protein n=1 Tax=Dreissena polymorpha TaxID=45954 RepID=A0A9D4EJV9_DREPO|nr:hypothetical protein DPMN_158945 [Dreissena polymorpha]